MSHLRSRLPLLLIFMIFALLSCTAPTPAQSTPEADAGVPVGTGVPAGAEELAEATPTEAAPQATPLTPPPTETPAQPTAAGYDLGNPTLTELYLSPTGDDANDGLTPSTPLQTLNAAWNKIPTGGALTGTGWRLNFLPGEYPCEPEEPDNCQNYFSDRTGTYAFPIILRAMDGPGTVTLRGGLELIHVAYVYLLDLTLTGGTPLPTNASGNNLLHFADVDHILLRGVTLDGPDCDNDGCNNLQEVLKVNQAQYFYVENSTIGGAWHSSVDYFVVQYGHFLNNHVHTAGQWCMYLKGGTSYLRLEGNEFEGCQLGFQAGQSANFAMMRAPWLHYDVYDIKFVNNLLHDLPGVALSISGGYNVLIAYNTLYNVGTSTDPGYPLLQTVFGERGCNPTDELPDPVPNCLAFIEQGGWGPNFLTDNTPVIPSRNVYIYNNLIVNPTPAQTLWTHFGILGPMDLPAGFQNLPDHPATDENLVIAGNLIWNGPADHPLGLDETTGCADTNPTCNLAQLLADNTINLFEPELINPAGGDYRPVEGGNVFSTPAHPIPDFTWDDAPAQPPVPAGDLNNTIPTDRDGLPRPSDGPPGAYGGGSAGAFHIFMPVLVILPGKNS